MDVDSSGFELLSRAECLRLLASTRIGRVGAHAGALPVILPVVFALDDKGVVIRVRAGTQLERATRDAVVCFEADDVDPSGGRGWSVAVTGEAREITEGAELERARGLPLEGWPGEQDDPLVRISLDLVSGRRGPLAVGPSPTEDGMTGPARDARGRPAAVAETHAGIVFFVGERAYKLKKPVDLGFLDFRTREARLAACRREVTLNRRLAPDAYLGVADLSNADGELCDHLVVMRRMPAERRLSSLVTSGMPVRTHLERLGEVLARFHQGAAASPAIDEAATRDANAERWEANAAEMARFRGEPLDPHIADEVSALARRYLAGRQLLFEHRIAAGRARDGHGDLLADDIFCLDDGPRVLDCLEFDDRLRFGDVLGDVAFLAMDLERLHRPDLALHFLDCYQAASGDSWPASLVDHYIAYRAQVRAKVACLRWAQGDPASAVVAGRLLRLCHDHLRRAQPRLVVVGGAPGTGKSTVARGVAASLGAAVLRSDEVRKEVVRLARCSPGPAGLDEGLYRPAATDATYAELLARARGPLGLGRTVVLDATWGDPRWRQAAARLAEETSADLVELRCTTPIDIAVERVSRRRVEATDPSDANEEVARVLAARAAPWPTATEVDTSGDADDAVAAALATLMAAPAAAGPPEPGRAGGDRMTGDDEAVGGDGTTLEEIPRDECFRLLAGQTIGRVAVADFGAAPLVVPVNFLLVGEAVVFRTDYGSKFRLAVLGEHPVSFQVDGVEPGRPSGWSVLLQGNATEAGETEHERLRLQPWAPGAKSHWVRIVPDTVSGRRIRLAPFPGDAGGYR